MSFAKPPGQSADHDDAVAPCELVVVQDHLQACPYLDDEVARMPLELPISRCGPGHSRQSNAGVSNPAATDWLLASGYRRSGSFVYRTACPNCCQCQPTRLDPKRFRWGSSFRRTSNRADRELRFEWRDAIVDARRVELFNLHRRIRDLSQHDEDVTAESYHSFLVDSCCDTMELSIYHDSVLIGISIVDVGADSLSAVYTHFDPGYSRFSIGTVAILKQIQWAIQRNYRWLYLGMYVRSNSHLNYKSRFGPQQRFIRGTWIDIND